MNIMVIGGYGQVGSIVVKNLCKQGGKNHIVIAGRSIDKANKLKDEIGDLKLQSMSIDVANIKKSQLSGIDTIIMCLEQDNKEVLKACIQLKINYIDITPSTQIINDLLTMQQECINAGIKVILGVGIAPGLSNIMAAQVAKDFDQVKKIDSMLMLGVGESHGVNAIKWLINNLNHTYLTDGEQGMIRVKSFKGKRKEKLHNDKLHTFTRIDLADSMINRALYAGAKCNSWFAYDVNYYTNMVCILQKFGLFYWLRFKKIRTIYEKIFIFLMKVSKKLGIGSDRYELIIKVEGTKANQMKSRTETYHGRCNNKITAQIAAESIEYIDKYNVGISYLVEYMGTRSISSL